MLNELFKLNSFHGPHNHHHHHHFDRPRLNRLLYDFFLTHHDNHHSHHHLNDHLNHNLFHHYYSDYYNLLNTNQHHHKHLINEMNTNNNNNYIKHYLIYHNQRLKKPFLQKQQQIFYHNFNKK